ncbi:hypothetical protein BCM0060_3444 [Bacillus cereus]|nr:hypothetical protein BCM0060_3444 [Bacillus cereus]
MIIIWYIVHHMDTIVIKGLKKSQICLNYYIIKQKLKHPQNNTIKDSRLKNDLSNLLVLVFKNQLNTKYRESIKITYKQK